MSDESTEAQLEDLWNVLRESNESRVAALEAKGGQQAQGSLENAFDALRILTFVEQIAMTVQCFDEASLVFESRRAEMLDIYEAKYAEMVAARETAERMAQWTQPLGPNRQQRRHGPQGIVKP